MLPNNPDCYMPGVLEALERHDPAQSTSSPEAKRSATWRRRRAIHPAESVPIGGRRGMFPKEIDASPASSDSCDWLHPAEPAATTGG